MSALCRSEAYSRNGKRDKRKAFRKLSGLPEGFMLTSLLRYIHYKIIVSQKALKVNGNDGRKRPISSL